ncbi:hypothetical protein Xph01_03940 [Micromonospora phaseoli]|nr:hypothetical protein Xph01_03940 [Micromonospora phaseoli]
MSTPESITATVTPAPVASGASRSGAYRCWGQGAADTGPTGAGGATQAGAAGAGAANATAVVGAVSRVVKPARRGRVGYRDIDRLRIVSVPERDVIASRRTGRTTVGLAL